jgi:hypothetical protein
VSSCYDWPPDHKPEKPRPSSIVLAELEEAIASPQEEGEDSNSTQEIPIVWINKVLFDLVMLPKGKGLQILEQLNTQEAFSRQYPDRSSEQPFSLLFQRTSDGVKISKSL